MLHCIWGNFYKMTHSKLLWLHIFIPLLAVLVFGAYYLHSSWKMANKLLIYMQVVAMAFPLMIAIVVSVVCEMDGKAGDFFNLLCVPCSKAAAHLSNLLSILILGLLAVSLAIFGFGAVAYITGEINFSFSIYVRAVLLLFGSNISVYSLQYIICYVFGKGVSLGAGIVGTLLSPLLFLGLGDGVWRYIPCSYGIRLVTYDFYLENGVLNKKMAEYIANDYRMGGSLVILITIILILLFLLWSLFWQGTRQKD